MPRSPRSIVVSLVLVSGLVLVVVAGLKFSSDRGMALWFLGGAVALVVLSIVLADPGGVRSGPGGGSADSSRRR
jgi:hypothetical protein